MRINHNIPALNAYRNLTMNTVLQGKSMEKLSSGLRINRAADDAAGLAISETMRGQIRGLGQASRNAQDAISLIQTAEGALTETHSILQRMRELAVQAANDTYTSSDRVEIQKEVDQLKEEIDRIANTTTFNNKNLLNGTAGAITSTDKLTTKVFMRGGLRVTDEFGRKIAGAGNYKLDIAATAGNAEIQKSNVFKNNHTGNTVQNLNIQAGTGIEHISATDVAKGTYSIMTTANLAIVATGIATATLYQSWRASGSTSTGVVCNSVTGTSGGSHNASILIEVATVTDEDANGTASAITYSISWYEYNNSGLFLNTGGTYDVSGNIALNSVQITANAASMALATGTFTLGSGSVIIALNDICETGVKVGDKIVVNQLGIRFTGSYDTVQITLSNGVAGASNVINWWFKDDYVENKTEKLYFMSIDVNDGTALDNGHIDMEVGHLDSHATSSTFVFGEGMGMTASLDTQLKDIDKFYDVNGKFLLDDPQKLTLVQGDGTRAQVVLYGTDSVRDVVQKLNAAIADQLGQADLVGTGDDDKFVSFVTSPDATGFETVEGTMILRSAKAGADGRINVIGNEGLINALGLANVQDSTESTFTITVTNAHDSTDVIASSVEIQGNTLIGTVHQNVDVKFDSNADIIATWNTANKEFDLTGDGSNTYSTYVHLVDNTQVFQIGANEMQDMGSAIGDMKAEALDINNILVTDRTSAGRAITKLDSAIGLVSSQRASLGAVQNRLEHTINNLGVAEENLTASESRIRDADMASEMMQFSKLNILSQAATAMLAQANQQPQQVLQLIGR